MQMNYRRINITLGTGVALMLVILLAISLYGFDQLQKLNELRDSYRRTTAVLTTLGSIMEAAQDGETGQRGFLLTGRQSYLDPYNKASARAKELLSQLRSLTAGQLKHASDVTALENAIDAKFVELRETIELRQTKGLPLATQVVLTDRGKRYMDTIRTILSQMREEQKSLLTLQSSELDNRAKQAFLGLLLISFIAIIFQIAQALIIMKFLRARKEAEANLKAVQESIAEALFQIDTNHKLVYANPAGEKLFGYKLAELKGKNLHELVHSLTPDGTEHRAEDWSLLNVMRTGVVFHEPCDYFIKKDGSSIPIEYTSAPLVRDGRIIGAVACMQDISERKEIERRVSEFYSTVSHELRTPLTSIRGTLSLMEGGRLGVLPEKAQNLAKIARAESERLIRLINDILDIRKIEAGKLELRFEEVSPSQMINETFQALESCR